MPPTDRPDTFFADLLLPLRRARLRRGLRYFPLSADPGASSYWSTPVTRTGGIQHRTLAEADGAALLSALAEYWLTQEEIELASLLAELEALRENLREAAPPEAERAALPSYSAYPLF